MSKIPEGLKSQILADSKTGLSARSLAKKYGLHHKTVSRLLKHSVGTKTEQHEVTADSWNISIPNTRICTLDQLIKHCQIDLGVWEVERFIANKWEVGAADDTGKIVVEPLFQVKAYLKRRKLITDIRREIDSLILLAKKEIKPVVTKYTRASGERLAVLNFVDTHLGRLAWYEETGENCDTKITEARFWAAFNKLVGQFKNFDVDRVLYVVGNDHLNSDNMAGTTTAGTPQSNDGRFHKTFVTARNLNIKAIESLRSIAKRVDVVGMPGNHDTLSAYMLTSSLECWFHSHGDVAVDNSPRLRKYYQFGKNMICLMHGNKIKPQQIPLLMATEESLMWSQCTTREAHLGHWHQQRLTEINGVVIRILPSLAGTDSYHFENGYTGNAKAAEALIYHKETGLDSILFYKDQVQ